ncbi:MAG: T9SS type A sorting domain-containing protein, partial [Bacteroidia bacterium]
NNSIGVYNHYDSLATNGRTFVLNTTYSANYAAQFFLVDSTTNNMQFRYDSLRSAGYTQNNAIATILPNQSLTHTNVMFNGGQYTVALQPNAVCLFKINIPGLSSVVESTQTVFELFPNPANEQCVVQFPNKLNPYGELELYSISGKRMQVVSVNSSQVLISTGELAAGVYFIRWTGAPAHVQKLIKE